MRFVSNLSGLAKRKQTKKTRTRVFVESLEQRRLLAGDTLPDDGWITIVDDGGPDDPSGDGQKDLTLAETNVTNINVTEIAWQWDEIDWSGGNTGDAAALMDTDSDGFADYAIAVTIGGDPLEVSEVALWECNDTRADRCGGAVEVPDPSSTVDGWLTGFTTTAVDPFDDPADPDPADDFDTRVEISIDMAELSAATATEIEKFESTNVCSFTSPKPNSAPSECVVNPDFRIKVDKVTNGVDGAIVQAGDEVTWTYTITNLGNASLTNILLVDDNGTPNDPADDFDVIPGSIITGDNGDGVLDTDEQWVVSVVGTAGSEDYANVATVSGDAGDVTVTDCDDSSYVVASLEVEKVLVGNGDEDGSASVTLGDTLSYAVTATNTSSIPLTDVVISDDLTGDTLTCDTVDPGASCELQTGYVVTQADVDAGEINNTATADTAETDPIDVSLAVDVPHTHSLSLVKELTANADEDISASVSLNDTLTYTLTATNSGNATLTNVSVSDDLTGDSITCASIAPGETCVLVTNHMVTQADVDAGEINNTGVADSLETDPIDVVLSVVVPQIYSLSLFKELTANADEDNSGFISLNDTLTYTLTATNSGNATLTDVSVSDDLTGDSTNCGSVAPGETCVLVTDYVVTQANVDAGEVNNTGTADSMETDPTTIGVSWGIPQTRTLGLVKELTSNADEDNSASVSLDDTLTYTLTATNTGNVSLTNVLVTDDLTGGAIFCGSVAPGETCVLVTNYVVTQADVDAGIITNIGAADSAETDPIDASLSVEVPQANSLSLTKELTANADEDNSASVSLNDTLTYTLTATNSGAQTLTSITVSDDLTGDSIICGSVAPGESCVLVTNYGVTQADVDEGEIINLGSAMGTSAGGDQFFAVDDLTVSVEQIISVSMEKSTNGQDADVAPGPTLNIGGNVTWTYTVTNTGTVTLSDVNVTDDKITSDLILLTGDDTGSDGLLSPGESWILSAVGTVTAGQYENVGTVTALGPQGQQISDSDLSHYFGGEITDLHGCTPGFWKNNWRRWEGVAWPQGINGEMTLEDVGFDGFTRGAGDETTLYDALNARGGGQSSLMRHAVAAFLNASHDLFAYPLGVTEVLSITNDALDSGDLETAKNELAADNELGCGVNQHGDPSNGEPNPDDEEGRRTPGDTNDDGSFDSTDLIRVFRAGKFERDAPANWAEGDWNGDGKFNTADVVLALRTGRYERPEARPTDHLFQLVPTSRPGISLDIVDDLASALADDDEAI